MKDAPAFDFYPERWLAGTAEMTDAEKVCYLTLLCHQWLRDGLPDDGRRLAAIIGRKVPKLVLEKLPVAADGLRRHPLMEKIRQAQRDRIAARRSGARMTNEKRRLGQPARGPQGEENLLAVAAGSAGRDAERGAGRDAGRGAERGAGRDAERSAGRSAGRDAEGVASATPPPTTHHPPQESSSSSSAGEGHEAGRGAASPSGPARSGEGGGRPYASVAEVTAYGGMIGASPECCEAFWQKCEGQGWMTDTNVPVHNWKPLLARFRKRWEERLFLEKQRERARQSGPGATGGAGARQAAFRAVPSSPSGLQTGWGAEYQKSHS